MDKTNEIPFRVVFGILWLLHFAVRLYFQSKVKGREYIRFNERQEIFFFRLFALAHFLLILYFVTPWIDFAHVSIPLWLRWAGAGITCAGIGLFGWTHVVLGKNWTAVLALSQKQELVTRGPYQYIRHPMYTAFFVIGFGFLFLSANGLVGVAYLGALTAMYVTRVSAEEEMMIGRFGDVYRDYMKKTGRLLPRLPLPNKL